MAMSLRIILFVMAACVRKYIVCTSSQVYYTCITWKMRPLSTALAASSSVEYDPNEIWRLSTLR